MTDIDFLPVIVDSPPVERVTGRGIDANTHGSGEGDQRSREERQYHPYPELEAGSAERRSEDDQHQARCEGEQPSTTAAEFDHVANL